MPPNYLLYALVLLAGMLALWLVRRYVRERTYRRHPYVAPAAANWAAQPPPRHPASS